MMGIKKFENLYWLQKNSPKKVMTKNKINLPRYLLWINLFLVHFVTTNILKNLWKQIWILYTHHN